MTAPNFGSHPISIRNILMTATDRHTNEFDDLLAEVTGAKKPREPVTKPAEPAFDALRAVVGDIFKSL